MIERIFSFQGEDDSFKEKLYLLKPKLTDYNYMMVSSYALFVIRYLKGNFNSVNI